MNILLGTNLWIFMITLLDVKLPEEIIWKYEDICLPTVNLFTWKAVAI